MFCLLTIAKDKEHLLTVSFTTEGYYLWNRKSKSVDPFCDDVSAAFPLPSLRYLPSLSANSIQAKLFLCTCAPLAYPAAAPKTCAVLCLINNSKTHQKNHNSAHFIDHNPISKKLYKQFINMNSNLKVPVLQRCIIKIRESKCSVSFYTKPRG